MKFDDNDLKRLKESENAIQRSLGIPALLARLEKSEQALVDYLESGQIHPTLLSNWLRSAGKE